ncbi:MAG: hypothetical protein BRD31_04320 [Bacteroidetes bacterium QH_2_64_26]|nr:MAG: hypothetical protein BRD31_04320 [Bacteroidetes bacterium QH_2_64_26]
MPIDTLKAARRLQEDDTFSLEQAERIAEILSNLDVASATKGDLDNLEGRLTERIDEVETRLNDRIDQVETRLGDRIDHLDEHIDEVEKHLGDRIDQTNDRINQTNDQIDSLGDRIGRLDEKAVTKAQLESVKSDLGKQIEETRSAMIRIVVGAVASMGAVLAVVISLAIYATG